MAVERGKVFKGMKAYGPKTPDEIKKHIGRLKQRLERSEALQAQAAEDLKNAKLRRVRKVQLATRFAKFLSFSDLLRQNIRNLEARLEERSGKPAPEEAEPLKPAPEPSGEGKGEETKWNSTAELVEAKGWKPPGYILKGLSPQKLLAQVAILEKEAKDAGIKLEIGDHWSRVHMYRDENALRKSFQDYAQRKKAGTYRGGWSSARKESGAPAEGSVNWTAASSHFRATVKSLSEGLPNMPASRQHDARTDLSNLGVGKLTEHEGLKGILEVGGQGTALSFNGIRRSEVNRIINSAQGKGIDPGQFLSFSENLRRAFKKHGMT